MLKDGWVYKQYYLQGQRPKAEKLDFGFHRQNALNELFQFGNFP